MTDRERLKKYGDLLGRQRKLIKAVQYLLITLFITLAIGAVSALPLRYFTGMHFTLPLFALLAASILSFIYGFLGITPKEELFREMDRNLGYNEKMSAAWQFGNSKNPYSRLLMEEAGEIMDRVEPKEVYKIHISRRDPFIPLLLALFLFLWLSGFSFLQISDRQLAMSDVLKETSERIDAVDSRNPDKELEVISDEYRKLAQKLKDQFMNSQSLDREVEKLSKRLENKIDSLSREGPQKESKAMGEGEPESEVYQLERKEEASKELQDILNSLMKTFSPSSELAYGSATTSRGETTESNGESPQTGSGDEGIGSDNKDDTNTKNQESTQPEQSPESAGPEKNQSESNSSSNKPGSSDKSSGSETPTQGDKKSQKNSEENQKSIEKTPEENDSSLYTERKESGEFSNNEDNIKGQQQKGEQMKSFIRALPHLVKPSREDMDVIHFYQNQLENSVDNEILPEGYEPVIRDYFLGIGVLKDE